MASSYPSYSKKKEFDDFVENFDFTDRQSIVDFFDENKRRFLNAHDGLYEKEFKSSAPKLRNCLIEQIHWSKKGRIIFLEKMKSLETNKKDPENKKTKRTGKRAAKKNIMEEKKIPTGKFPDDELEEDQTMIFQ